MYLIAQRAASGSTGASLLLHLRRKRRCKVPSGIGKRRIVVVLAVNDSGDSNAFPGGGQGGTAELSKNFEPAARERMIYTWWEGQGLFKPMGHRASETFSTPFVISMPPPNVTGALHMGHAMFVTFEDILVRYWRLRGRDSLWVPGADHAGIATQLMVEKDLAKKGLPGREEMGREAFEAAVWEWKEQYGDRISTQMRCLGASCDWSRGRFTLDEEMSQAVAETFVRLHDKGLIYKGSYMVNWSPALKTAVSDLEVDYVEEPSKLYYFKYPVLSKNGESEAYLPIATTRPETILGDSALAVHPEDERYAKYIGKFARIPLGSDRKIPIISDDYVDREFGTGALKITPGHDINDYELGKRHNLEVINIMNRDATLNEKAGEYCGMDRFDARKKIWEDMEVKGIAIKVEETTSRVPRSQRGGEVVEPLVSQQWFVKMEPLAEPALKAVQDGTINIVPDRFQKVYFRWLENIKDWCVSRQLWWGHRIPVWYIESKNTTQEKYVVARNKEEAIQKAQNIMGEDQEWTLRQDEDVLDTWFSSGLWPFSTLGWPKQTEDLARFYPTTVMETGYEIFKAQEAIRTSRTVLALMKYDILFFWVARMITMGLEMTGKAPFQTVYLHGLVRDAQGRKMSKTTGNVIDPLDVIDEYGADPLRYSLVTGTAPGQDLNLSMDKIAANRNFVNKIWNAAKYLLHILSQQDANISYSRSQCIDILNSMRSDMPLPEQWILGKLATMVEEVNSALSERYDFNEYGRVLYEFLWNDFADWYIEISKSRIYQKENKDLSRLSVATLTYVLDSYIRILHPVMPYVSEEIFQALTQTIGKEVGENALINARWPQVDYSAQDAVEDRFDTLQLTVKSIRNARAEYDVEIQKRIPAIILTSSEDSLGDLSSEIQALCTLAKLDESAIEILNTESSNSASLPSEDDCVKIVVKEHTQVLLPLSGMMDVEKERKRIAKQMAKLEKDRDQVSKQLSSPKFVDKAPAAVVADARKRYGEADEQIRQLEARIKELDALEAKTVA